MKIRSQAVLWAVGALTLMALLMSNLYTRRMRDRSILFSSKQPVLLQRPVIVRFGNNIPVPPVRVVNLPVSEVDDLDIIADMTINSLKFRHEITKVKMVPNPPLKLMRLQLALLLPNSHAITAIHLLKVRYTAWYAPAALRNKRIRNHRSKRRHEPPRGRQRVDIALHIRRRGAAAMGAAAMGAAAAALPHA